MIDQIQEAFPNIEEECLTIINDKHVFIFEDDKAVFVTAKEKRHLHIENKTNDSFYFIQNDDCVMKYEKGGQCDYIILNNENIYFTEIKVAKKNFANHRKDAYSQIKNTFTFYNKKIKFNTDQNLYAFICFPSPRRTINVSALTKRKEFKENYGLNLIEGNYISFE